MPVVVNVTRTPRYSVTLDNGSQVSLDMTQLGVDGIATIVDVSSDADITVILNNSITLTPISRLVLDGMNVTNVKLQRLGGVTVQARVIMKGH